jgi:Tfp pilus assembly PilM family ATPase
MVEVKHSGQSKEFLTYGIASHNLDLEGFWNSNKLKQISIIIEDLINTGNFIGTKTVMSVMSKDVYVTTMDFDATWSKRQIDDEIQRQAHYFLPYPPEEMRISWNPITTNQTVTQMTGSQRYIINALPEFVVENSRNLLEHVNLDGAALENQTVSQIRSALNPDQGNTILVDIGAAQTTFSIVVDGVLRSSSHIPSGADKVSQEISKNLGVENEIAEYFKRDLHLVNIFDLPVPILDYFNILKSELRTFVELNRRVAQDPHKIVFTGGGVSTMGFAEFFREFELPVYVANPLRRISINEEYKPFVLPIVNQMSTALGLSLRTDV